MKIAMMEKTMTKLFGLPPLAKAILAIPPTSNKVMETLFQKTNNKIENMLSNIEDEMKKQHLRFINECLNLKNVGTYILHKVEVEF